MNSVIIEDEIEKSEEYLKIKDELESKIKAQLEIDKIPMRLRCMSSLLAL